MTRLYEHTDKEGRPHKDDGPAIAYKYPDGTETQWYKHGRKHRIGGPAIDGPNYTEYWLEGQPHHDGGPSITYHKGNPDGTGIGQKLYHLHGVQVSEELATMTDQDFDPSMFFEEKNVEVRREIIRKFGIERIFKTTKKTNEDKLKQGEGMILDAQDDYELIRIRLTKETLGTYLKMKNPSIGTFHMEGVPHEIKTVEDAISWRNHGLKGNPEILS